MLIASDDSQGSRHCLRAKHIFVIGLQFHNISNEDAIFQSDRILPPNPLTDGLQGVEYYFSYLYSYLRRTLFNWLNKLKQNTTELLQNLFKSLTKFFWSHKLIWLLLFSEPLRNYEDALPLALGLRSACFLRARFAGGYSRWWANHNIITFKLTLYVFICSVVSGMLQFTVFFFNFCISALADFQLKTSNFCVIIDLPKFWFALLQTSCVVTTINRS